MFSFIKRLIKRKKSSGPKAPQRDLTNKEWGKIAAQERKKERARATKTKQPKPEHSTKRRKTSSRQANAQVRADAELVGKYIITKGRKTAREFANDMGVSTKAMAKEFNEGAPKVTKRTTIPKEITFNGVSYTRYCNYDGNPDPAREAANDMQEMGYLTKIVKFQRKSYPVYVLYRYKKGTRSSGAPAKRKTTTARRQRSAY